MRNTRNVAPQDTVTGAVSLPGGGRSSSLSVIPSARPRPLSTAPFACIFLSCSIFNSSCIPVFCAALSGAAAALPRRWPQTRFRIRRRRCRPIVPTRRTHARQLHPTGIRRHHRRHHMVLVTIALDGTDSATSSFFKSSVQHRPHMADDEPVVHPHVRGAFRSAPPPLSHRPPAPSLGHCR